MSSVTFRAITSERADEAMAAGRCVQVRRADGSETILNFRFGQGSDRSFLIRPEDAPADLVARGRRVIAAMEEYRYRRSAARLAAIAEHPMAKILRDDAEAAEERLGMAGASYRARLDKIDRRGVLVVDGHSLGLSVAARWEVDVVRLDGLGDCDACDGCGMVAADDGLDACGTCDGEGMVESPGRLPWCLRDVIDAYRQPTPHPSNVKLPLVACDRVDPAYQQFMEAAAFGGF